MTARRLWLRHVTFECPSMRGLEASRMQRRGAHLHRVTYDVANVTIVLREGGAFEAPAFPKQMRAAALFRCKFRPPQHEPCDCQTRCWAEQPSDCLRSARERLCWTCSPSQCARPVHPEAAVTAYSGLSVADQYERRSAGRRAAVASPRASVACIRLHSSALPTPVHCHRWPKTRGCAAKGMAPESSTS